MIKLIQDIEKKIQLQRGIHSYFERKEASKAIVIKTISIVFPAILTFIAFSDFNFLKIYLPSLTENLLKLSIGLLSLTLFLIGVISEIFGITVKHEKHRDAIENYSKLLRDIKEAGDSLSESQIIVFNQRYNQIAANTIPIKDKCFRKAEKYYLKSNAIRKAQQLDPFANFWAIRKKAIALTKE